ncbi:MAG: hypothetical protein PHZ23_14840 [Acidiphilium sp.]|nr:hypothetical protein [Acidiphilium sp.]
MNYAQVQAQLNDLPATFKRLGNPYGQWIDALTSALALFTNAGDATILQIIAIGNATGRWLDIWGIIYGFPRFYGEADQLYRARITSALTAPHVTMAAIVNWAAIYSGFVASVSDTAASGGIGYTITIPQSLTASQIARFLQSLAYVRPAGVPFQVLQGHVSLFVDTVNYEGGAAGVTGSYLGSNATPLTLNIPASTNNAQPLLPDFMLNDPTLNPN